MHLQMRLGPSRTGVTSLVALWRGPRQVGRHPLKALGKFCSLRCCLLTVEVGTSFPCFWPELACRKHAWTGVLDLCLLLLMTGKALNGYSQYCIQCFAMVCFMTVKRADLS